VVRYIEGFSYFVTSITAPIASGWSEIAGSDLHPLGKRRLSTAHAMTSRSSLRRNGHWNGCCSLKPAGWSVSAPRPELPLVLRYVDGRYGLLTGSRPKIVMNDCFPISYPAAPDTQQPVIIHPLNDCCSAVADLHQDTNNPVSAN